MPNDTGEGTVANTQSTVVSPCQALPYHALPRLASPCRARPNRTAMSNDTGEGTVANTQSTVVSPNLALPRHALPGLATPGRTAMPNDTGEQTVAYPQSAVVSPCLATPCHAPPRLTRPCPDYLFIYSNFVPLTTFTPVTVCAGWLNFEVGWGGFSAAVGGLDMCQVFAVTDSNFSISDSMTAFAASLDTKGFLSRGCIKCFLVS